MNPHYNAIRRFLAAALCDFTSYLDKLPDPIIVGGQYPDDRLVRALVNWARERKLSLSDPSSTEWASSCTSGALWLQEETTHAPEQLGPQEEPAPPPEEEEEEDTELEEGYYKEDSWEPPEERNKPWYETGEGWKDDEDEESAPA